MAFGTSGVGSLKRKSETPPVTPGYNFASSSDSNIRAQSDESHSMKLKIKVNNTFCDGTFVLTEIVMDIRDVFRDYYRKIFMSGLYILTGPTNSSQK